VYVRERKDKGHGYKKLRATRSGRCDEIGNAKSDDWYLALFVRTSGKRYKKAVAIGS